MKDSLTTCYICSQPLGETCHLLIDSDGCTRRVCDKCYGRLFPTPEHVGGKGHVQATKLTGYKDFYQAGYDAGVEAERKRQEVKP